MKIDVLSVGSWFRHLGSPMEFDGPNSKVTIPTRAVYCIAPNKGSLVITQDMNTFVPISEKDAEMMVENSKPYMGKIDGISVKPGKSTFKDSFSQLDSIPDLKPAVVKIKREDPDKAHGKIPGSKPVNFVRLDKPKMFPSLRSSVMPPSDSMYDMVEKSLGYLGTRIPFKFPIKIAVGPNFGTSIVTQTDRTKANKDIYIVIDPPQLQRLFGSITVELLAQVLTHELAHYALKNVVRNSDLIMFKRQIAAKKLHKDQFNHPGYSYPWWDEAFAILCEAMVHGRSARGFSTPIGWEIAEKYFVNRYLKDGNYTGSYDSV